MTDKDAEKSIRNLLQKLGIRPLADEEMPADLKKKFNEHGLTWPEAGLLFFGDCPTNSTNPELDRRDALWGYLRAGLVALEVSRKTDDSDRFTVQQAELTLLKAEGDGSTGVVRNNYDGTIYFHSLIRPAGQVLPVDQPPANLRELVGQVFKELVAEDHNPAARTFTRMLVDRCKRRGAKKESTIRRYLVFERDTYRKELKSPRKKPKRG